ncbi:hypothetical protein NE237_004126 [Protea cynaroides]|uniref:Uncharacterized protein n=1 Tax=Protea cynaroides TaxID=273540 RepID=A0A9Q0KIA6_9MAGN|nr:hypothetical protein NE237_004126 [Protea cynaroides]
MSKPNKINGRNNHNSLILVIVSSLATQPDVQSPPPLLLYCPDPRPRLLSHTWLNIPKISANFKFHPILLPNLILPIIHLHKTGIIQNNKELFIKRKINHCYD